MNVFAEALYQIALEEGNTLTLEGIRNSALQMLQSGETKSLVSTTVNSKSFSFHISKPADVLFAEVSWAIRKFNNGIITGTIFDFSLLYM